MENEGLNEGARPRIEMHPPKMGDRRWEERVTGAESGSKYDGRAERSSFPPVGPFLTKYFFASIGHLCCLDGT